MEVINIFGAVALFILTSFVITYAAHCIIGKWVDHELELGYQEKYVKLYIHRILLFLAVCMIITLIIYYTH